MRISIGGTRKLYSNKDIMFERILKKETRFFQQMESRCRWKNKGKKILLWPSSLSSPVNAPRQCARIRLLSKRNAFIPIFFVSKTCRRLFVAGYTYTRAKYVEPSRLQLFLFPLTLPYYFATYISCYVFISNNFDVEIYRIIVFIIFQINIPPRSNDSFEKRFDASCAVMSITQREEIGGTICVHA